MPINIFISYCSDNKNKMDALKRAIVKTNGVLAPIVIADQRKPRTDLSEKVKDGIKEAGYIVPIITRESIYTQWINQEIGYAEALGKTILPIVEDKVINELKGFIHKNQDLPYRFNSNSAKSKETSDYRKCYNLLIQDIIREIGGSSKAPSMSSLVSDRIELLNKGKFNLEQLKEYLFTAHKEYGLKSALLLSPDFKNNNHAFWDNGFLKFLIEKKITNYKFRFFEKSGRHIVFIGDKKGIIIELSMSKNENDKFKGEIESLFIS